MNNVISIEHARFRRRTHGAAGLKGLVKTQPNPDATPCIECGRPLTTSDTVSIIRNGPNIAVRCRSCMLLDDGEPDVCVMYGASREWRDCSVCFTTIAPDASCELDLKTGAAKCRECWSLDR